MLAKYSTEKVLLYTILMGIFIVGILTVGDYGITYDEPIEIDMVKWHFEYATSNIDYPEPLIRYYGIVFNGFCELIYSVAASLNLVVHDTSLHILASKIQIKHFLTFLWTFSTYFFVTGIVRIITSPQPTAKKRPEAVDSKVSNFKLEYWIAPIVLTLFPRFWGHGFFNPKDIPFAVLFTLVTLIGTKLAGLYLDTSTQPSQLARRSIAYGILVGILGGIRPIGIISLVFFGLTCILVVEKQIGWRKIIFRLIPYYMAAIFTCLITLFILYPSAWNNPFSWLISSFTVLSKYPWYGHILFSGNYIPSNSLPWSYIPKYILISIPEISILISMIGIILAVIKYKNFSAIQKSAFVLVGFQTFTLPIMAILNQSTLYDEIRHFLFVVPGMAIYGSTALIWLSRLEIKKIARISAFSILIVSLTSILIDMHSLHPYEYTYFNHLSGGLASAQYQYESDYWGLSFKESTQWLNTNVHKQNQKVVILGAGLSVLPFLRSDFQVVSAQYNYKIASNIRTKTRPHIFKEIVSSAFSLPAAKTNFKEDIYIIAIRRWEFNNVFSECPILHEVKRDGATLSVIRKCIL
jgi:hypothetical protein